MKKFILILFIFLGLTRAVQAKTVKFIQVTDIHLTQNNAQYLKQFTEDINKKFNDLDFIVFTGDNINNPKPADLELFLDTIKNLKVKPYVLVGNHDLYKSNNLTQKSYMNLVHKKLGTYHPSKANYVFQKGNTIFITMNGVKEIIPGSCGYYRQEELVWLDKMLTKYSNKKVVILQHFPLIDTTIKGHSLYRKDDYEKILAKHNNIISIISGHYHINKEEKQDGIYHIITNKFSNNTYYKVIEVDEESNMVYTFLVNNNETNE